MTYISGLDENLLGETVSVFSHLWLRCLPKWSWAKCLQLALVHMDLNNEIMPIGMDAEIIPPFR